MKLMEKNLERMNFFWLHKKKKKRMNEGGSIVSCGYDFMYSNFILFFYIHLIICNFLIGCF